MNMLIFRILTLAMEIKCFFCVFGEKHGVFQTINEVPLVPGIENDDAIHKMIYND